MNLTIIYHAGLEENGKAFYREFARQGIKVSVIVPRRVKHDFIYTSDGFLTIAKEDFEPVYNLIPVDLINIYKYNLGFHPLQLFRALKISKPDVIQVLNEYTSFPVTQIIFNRNILYGRKVPVIAYAFQSVQFKSLSLNFNFSLEGLRRIINKIAKPFIFAYNRKYVDGVTTANAEALESVKMLNNNIPVRRIFWGMDLKNFYPKNRDLCRRKIGLPENIKVVGYFGRFIKEKGLDILAEAISRTEGCHLMLVGRGSYMGELNKIFNSLEIENRVHQYNCIAHRELVDYYNSLDAFVLPSRTTSGWKEQYGRVLAEALGCNITIIGSSSGAIPEVLNGYPKHFIFKEDDVDDLIDKMNKIERLEFPEDFKISVFLNKFSVKNFVSKHIELYERLLLKKEVV